MNNINIVGRITNDLELKVTPSGTEVLNFPVAVNRAYGKDEQGRPISDFFRCVAFGKTAVFISQYFGKGGNIQIIGEMQSEKYEKDGKKLTDWKCIIEKCGFCGQSRSEQATSATAAPTPAPSIPDTANMQTLPADEELPF